MGRFVVYSVVGHCLVFLVFGFRFFAGLDESIRFENSIHVDLVALPDKMLADKALADKVQPGKEVSQPPMAQAQTPPPPTPPADVHSKKTDENSVNLDRSKKKQNQAFERLKEMSAFEKLKNEMEQENRKKIDVAISKVHKGNILSTGSGLTGLNKLEADQYVSEVDRHIRRHWTLPEYLKNRNLRAEILVRFNESGMITLKNIVRSSGNASFDEIVLAAVQKSSPVPPPPEKFVGISSGEGFLFRFSE